jgi:tRNA 2-selenouridine synthase
MGPGAFFMEPSIPTEQTPWAVPMVRVSDVLAARGASIVDLRTPLEFAADHLPGAVNVPLFDNAERALIGTLYKRASPDAAFDEGRRLVMERIATLIEELSVVAQRPVITGDLASHVERLTSGGIAEVNRALSSEVREGVPPGSLVVHCWRGGMRSSSLATLLRELGWQDVYVLAGGYKSYRRHLLSELDAWVSPPALILRGSTGVGKTLVLREIERRRPGLTLDLEGLAGHRSSILGMVGLEPCSQKVFDSRLAERLRQGFPGKVVIEGESRKVGDSIVPPSVWSPLQEGTHLYLEAPRDYRVQVLIDDYLANEGSREELRLQLPFIERRMGPKKWEGRLVELLDERKERELTEILLESYYDPLYDHSEKGRTPAAHFDASDVGRVTGEILDWIDARS